MGRMPESHLHAVLHSHGWLYLCPAEETATGFRHSMTLPDAGACSITVKPVRGTLVCEADRILSAADRTALRQVVRPSERVVRIGRLFTSDAHSAQFDAAQRVAGARLHIPRLRRASGWLRLWRACRCRLFR